MRLVRISSHEIPIKANQAAKLRYRQEFGTSLTGDVVELLAPLMQDKAFLRRMTDGGISTADIVKLVLSPGNDVQDVMTRVLWACAWAADRSIPDFDQWTDAIQDKDEAAFSLFSDGDLSRWVVDVELAVGRAFLGIDPTASVSSQVKSRQKK
jgi:hypothetical protein